MTKPFIPEFEDREGALRYIADARRSSTERPTKDFWNTRVVLSDKVHGIQSVELHLNGKRLIRYEGAPRRSGGVNESIIITPDVIDYTTRKRITDYVFQTSSGPGFTIEPDGHVMGIVAEARGNADIPIPIGGRIGQLTPGSSVVLNDGALHGLGPVIGDIIPRSYLRERIRDWAKGILQAAARETFAEAHNSPDCIACSRMSPIQSAPLAEYTGDTEHLFAHVFGNQISARILRYYAGVRVTEDRATMKTHLIEQETIPVTTKSMEQRLIVRLAKSK